MDLVDNLDVNKNTTTTTTLIKNKGGDNWNVKMFLLITLHTFWLMKHFTLRVEQKPGSP